MADSEITRYVLESEAPTFSETGDAEAKCGARIDRPEGVRDSGRNSDEEGAPRPGDGGTTENGADMSQRRDEKLAQGSRRRLKSCGS